MPDEEDFSCGPQCPQDASASPQSNAAQEAGLHTAKTTDLRDFEDWANDEPFCQQLLANRPSTWRTAVERYWRSRCTRRELANKLGADLETTKNLLRRIRKVAKDFQSGMRLAKPEDGVRYPGRPHCEINAQDIEAICVDRDIDAIAHMEEYGRLNIIERLNLFSPEISGELIKTFQHLEASNNGAITSALLKVEQLKAKVVKPDPFEGHAVCYMPNLDQHTRMKIPETDGSGNTRWKARMIGCSESEPIERGRPRKQVQPPERLLEGLRIIPMPPVSFLGEEISQG